MGTEGVLLGERGRGAGGAGEEEGWEMGVGTDGA